MNLGDLVRATAPRLGRYFLRATVAVSGLADEKQPVLRGYRCMQLHPCFASTIRAAQASQAAPSRSIVWLVPVLDSNSMPLPGSSTTMSWHSYN